MSARMLPSGEVGGWLEGAGGFIGLTFIRISWGPQADREKVDLGVSLSRERTNLMVNY
jgi:hypothetical protein